MTAYYTVIMSHVLPENFQSIRVAHMWLFINSISFQNQNWKEKKERKKENFETLASHLWPEWGLLGKNTKNKKTTKTRQTNTCLRNRFWFQSIITAFNSCAEVSQVHL